MKYEPSSRRAAAAAAACIACAANAAPNAELAAARDSASVIASDQMVEAAAAYCDRESPAEGAKLRTAQAQWRQRHDVNGVRERMPPKTAAMSADATRRVHERMAAQGQPAKVCAQMTAMLGSADMNLRERYPAAYAAAPSGATTPAAARRPQDSDTRAATAATTAPGTLLLNPAQLGAIVERTPYVKGQSATQRLQAAGLAGPLAIEGLVVRRGEHFFIEHQEGAFHSRMSVSPGVGLKDHEGRKVVVAGRLDEWPSSLAFLRNSRIVDARGLEPSREPTAPGMVRMPVGADRISTAPGKGVATSDVAGVLYHGRGATGGDGNYTFKEDAVVFFRDGWAYGRLDVPPSDLNVKASRELEPQRWGKWRRAGNGHEVQWQDDHGRPRGDWRKAEGRLEGPWPAGAKLRGAYVAMAFHGSIGLGGTFTRNTRMFSEEGGYEDSRFAQSHSGSMAASAGFSSSTTSTSGKTGSSSVSGSTSSASPTAAPNVGVYTNAKRDDGAEHRGRYALDGYTLEIRRDNGRVDRYLTFKPTGADQIWIDGRSFSRPSK